MLTAKSLRRLQAKALQNGGFHPTDMPSLVEWDISGRCETPRHRLMHARDEARDNVKWRVNPGTASVRLWCPCRQCPPCLRYRGAQWRERATVEIIRSTRTWFATFTMSPEEHFLAWLRIQQRLRQENGGCAPPLDVREEFNERCADMGKLLTNYFKRLRKTSASPIRYLLVAERHKSGYPHFHALIHEIGPPVTYRALAGEWPHGFTHFKLVEDRALAARYVAKYISKSVLARVRASLRYGL